jgi:hypothetical protein
MSVVWMLRELVKEEGMKSEEGRKEMKRERQQSAKYFHFVSIWQPLWIVMTDQSQRISRADRSPSRDGTILE